MEGKSNKHTKAFSSKLLDGEHVVAFADGYIGKMMGKGDDTQHNGCLIVTNTRVVFYRKGLLGEVLKTVPFENISSIDTLSSMGHRTVSMFYSNNSLEFRTFETKEFLDDLVDGVKSMISGKVSSTHSSEVQGEGFELKLKKLADLHASGILTDEEFSTKKAEILGKI